MATPYHSPDTGPKIPGESGESLSLPQRGSRAVQGARDDVRARIRRDLRQQSLDLTPLQRFSTLTDHMKEDPPTGEFARAWTELRLFRDNLQQKRVSLRTALAKQDAPAIRNLQARVTSMEQQETAMTEQFQASMEGLDLAYQEKPDCLELGRFEKNVQHRIRHLKQHLDILREELQAARRAVFDLAAAKSSAPIGEVLLEPGLPPPLAQVEPYQETAQEVKELIRELNDGGTLLGEIQFQATLDQLQAAGYRQVILPEGLQNPLPELVPGQFRLLPTARAEEKIRGIKGSHYRDSFDPAAPFLIELVPQTNRPVQVTHGSDGFKDSFEQGDFNSFFGEYDSRLQRNFFDATGLNRYVYFYRRELVPGDTVFIGVIGSQLKDALQKDWMQGAGSGRNLQQMSPNKLQRPKVLRIVETIRAPASDGLRQIQSLLSQVRRLPQLAELVVLARQEEARLTNTELPAITNEEARASILKDIRTLERELFETEHRVLATTLAERKQLETASHKFALGKLWWLDLLTQIAQERQAHLQTQHVEATQRPADETFISTRRKPTKDQAQDYLAYLDAEYQELSDLYRQRLGESAD